MTLPHVSHPVLRIRDYLELIFGAILLAFAVTAYMAPNRILDGGFTGIAILLHHLFNTPIGSVALALMSVALVVGYYKLGPTFGFRTIFATVLFTLSIDFFNHVLQIEALTDDLTLAVFYGGTMAGFALSLIFHAGGSTGGTDVIATLIKRSTGISVGRVLLFLDLGVAFVAGLFFGARLLMYSLILIFIETQVIDLVLNGFSATKRLWIVSERAVELREHIVQDLGRGATLFEGTGGFTDEPRKVIITYVPRRLVGQLMRDLHDLDPDVFVAVDSAAQVYGEGFRSFKNNP
ncbi:YitT family protein [Myxococcota bacterium]|nr:YitT family protein [Myxococcota bacterium]MBU1410361.1 YitT family protein [Myxococcota bacterium]MBU1510428.1 YitT family protein [Myxococcota bacterium]